MTLNLLSLSSGEPLAAQLDQVFSDVDNRFSVMCPELIDNCRYIQKKTHFVIDLAKKYDFRDIEANGYWTYVRLVVKFGKLSLISPPDHCRTHLLPVSIVSHLSLIICVLRLILRLF